VKIRTISEISGSDRKTKNNSKKQNNYMKYSFIIPVYNRPDEVDELLYSMTLMEIFDDNISFEVIIVEDGSTIPCKDITDKYKLKLNIKYYKKENGGPAIARNYGVDKATGDYVITVDSDTIIPPHYLQNVTKELNETQADAFGGADAAADNFTRLQKAINYTMTSFLTTGGIRGKKKGMDKFYPRGYNMGVKREVWNKLGGFSNQRISEDIDLSIRLYNAGYKVLLFPTAWVYHKRRTSFIKFFKQVYMYGISRIENLYTKFPDSLKLVHILPTIFTLGVLFLLAGSIFCKYSALPLLLYILLLLTDATIKTKSILIAFQVIIAAFVQFFAYGIGFMVAVVRKFILRTKTKYPGL